VFFVEIVKAKKAKDKSKKKASIVVNLLSSTKKTGNEITKNDNGKLIRPAFSLNVTVLFKTAKRGITKRIKIVDPPIRLPTEISGVLSTNEKKATEISLKDVRTPRAKKETINEEMFTFREMRSTDVIEIPAPVQSVMKEISMREISISIL
jgi:hypothetical protein